MEAWRDWKPGETRSHLHQHVEKGKTLPEAGGGGGGGAGGREGNQEDKKNISDDLLSSRTRSFETIYLS